MSSLLLPLFTMVESYSTAYLHREKSNLGQNPKKPLMRNVGSFTKMSLPRIAKSSLRATVGMAAMEPPKAQASTMVVGQQSGRRRKNSFRTKARTPTYTGQRQKGTYHENKPIQKFK